jgi:predicted porin
MDDDELDDVADEVSDGLLLQAPDCVDTSTSGSDPAAWSAGLNLGMSGFTIGGSYADWNKAGGNMETFDLGVSYATGPWGVSFTYVHSELNDDENGEIDKFLLGMDYKLAKGIRLGAFGIYVDGDSDSGLESYDGDGWILGTDIKLNF